MSKTIFQKIIDGDLPCYKIAESDDYFAFLDIGPMTKGHTLVVPKHNVTDYIFDLEAEQLAGLTVFAQKVAKAIQKTVTCNRVAILVVGTEVPHAHLHLIPFMRPSEVKLGGKVFKISREEMEILAKEISSKVILY